VETSHVLALLIEFLSSGHFMTNIEYQMSVNKRSNTKTTITKITQAHNKERKQTKNTHKKTVIEQISSLISIIAPAMQKMKKNNI
jgi:hypothetical protein